MKILRRKKELSGDIRLTFCTELHDSFEIIYINAFPGIKENYINDLKTIRNYLIEEGIEIVFGLSFGITHNIGIEELYKILPLLYLGSPEIPLPCIQIVCLKGLDVRKENNPAGARIRSFEYGGTKQFYYTCQDVLKDSSYREQAYRSFTNLSQSLEMKGHDFSHIARTWLFLESINDWYDDLNYSRSEFFNEKKVFENIVPASTGVGISNPLNNGIVLSAFGLVNSEQITSLNSPMQCPAIDYRSAFSRAVEFVLPDSKKILISGTAAIDNNGDTLFAGNGPMQIKHTFKVISSLLDSYRYDFINVVRIIAYFKDLTLIRYFDEICSEYGLDPDYILKVQADICRPDLEFEMELDAIIPL